MVRIQQSGNGNVGVRCLLRAALYSFGCSIWYGVQSSIGGTCVLVMLRAIWPSVDNIRELHVVLCSP